MMRLTRFAAQRPRMYFVHIPKTAGVTLKTYLENHYAEGEALVIDEDAARALPPETLRRYRLLSGHYSSEVLEGLGERPDVTLMLVREPVARARSWAAHCRRFTDGRYRETFEGRTDIEAMDAPGGEILHQAHWMARALHAGARYTGVPAVADLPGLLAAVDLAGVTEHTDRFLQLVAYRMGWPPPPVGWHINRRPDPPPADPTPEAEQADARLRQRLAVDIALYAQVEARFWQQYGEMVEAIDPERRRRTPAELRDLPLTDVQGWLRDRDVAAHQAGAAPMVTAIDVTGDDPLAGEGWWWRERPNGIAYRWTGPGRRGSLHLPPLSADYSYSLTIDFMGAADWQVWDGLRLEINGRPAHSVRERFAPIDADAVSLRLRALVTPDMLAGDGAALEVALCLPETKQALRHVLVCESIDTYNHDTRAVGVAVRRVSIRAAA